MDSFERKIGIIAFLGTIITYSIIRWIDDNDFGVTKSISIHVVGFLIWGIVFYYIVKQIKKE